MPALAEFAVDSNVFSRALDKGAEEFRVRSQIPRSEDGKTAVRVLLVGCGAELQSQLVQRLVLPQWSLREAASGSEAIEKLHEGSSEVLLLAPTLPDLDAEEFQQLVRLQFPHVQIINLDAQFAYSILPPAPAIGDMSRSHGKRATAPIFSGLDQKSDGQRTGWQGLLGASSAMERVFRMATLVAKRDTTVLIQGESGTGKDLLAHGIHQCSSRAKQPFVVINCAAIPDTLLEAELFGYTKGAFTGASQSKLGRVHAAHGGTLFLDEIGEMPLPLQSKILRFLEQGEVQRIGGSDTLKVDCRIIAATNVNLQEQVKSKAFREDLYYRLAVVPISMPALRQRMEDLALLCTSFLERFSPGSGLSTDALEVLLNHHWPGNVRELRNVMERASLFADGRPQISAEDIVL